MSEENSESQKIKTSAGISRQARLKAALKANIAKRKAQARARRPGQMPTEKDKT